MPLSPFEVAHRKQAYSSSCSRARISSEALWTVSSKMHDLHLITGSPVTDDPPRCPSAVGDDRIDVSKDPPDNRGAQGILECRVGDITPVNAQYHRHAHPALGQQRNHSRGAGVVSMDEVKGPFAM